jgi:pimeloyl-ACP methyl ester carboxylesterase
VPSTFKLFRALTQYPSLERLLDLHIPSLVVLGDRDPLMPGPARVREVAGQTDNKVLAVTIQGAAHAINFSHARELAHVIRRFMADQSIIDDPTWTGRERVVEIHRGSEHPPAR